MSNMPHLSRPLIFTLFLLTGLAGAAESLQEAETLQEAGYTVIPGLKISPEIGIGIGTMVVNPASPRQGARMEYRGLYTTRGQSELRVSNRTTKFWGSRWEMRLEADLQRFLDNYFGGGNTPVDEDEVEYIPTGGYAFNYWTRRLTEDGPPINFVGGARVDAYRIDHVRRVDGGPGAD